MSQPGDDRLARRFLHSNLNTRDAEAAVAFYGQLAGLRLVMRTTSEPTDGALFGMSGERTHSDAWFCYDDRGARAVVGLELQQWYDPPVEGAPYADPRTPGMQALGLVLPSLDGAGEQVVRLGGSVVGSGTGAVLAPGSTRTLWVRDRDGVLVELVEQPALAAPGRMHRLVISTRELDRTLSFYGDVGFAVSARARIPDAAAWMPTAPEGSSAEAVSLTLPDDPAFSVLLLAWDPPDPGGSAYARACNRGLYRCALATDDIALAYKRLVAQGWERIDEPRTAPLAGTPLGQVTVMFTRDPQGVTVELVERPRTAFRA
jgi:catechol 2,3-dioxygenase-like lactoylglutathione lyase family enzyme